jgi:Holliday junction resolvase
MKYKLLYYNGKRPNHSKTRLKKELIDYIKRQYQKKHIPSRREIENKFHIRLDSLFKNIKALYESAKLKYKLNANQSLKAKKAGLLLELITKNLDKFGLKLIEIRNVHDRGVDIIAINGTNKIGIELKAYNKYEKIKIKDLNQVKRFIQKENLNKVIIITTTDIKNKEVKNEDKIELILYNDLVRILKDKKFNKKLDYIREYSINREDPYKEIRRQKILDYVYKKYKFENKKPSCLNISKELHLTIGTYFENFFQIYKILKIAPPTKDMRGPRSRNPDKEVINLWKENFKKFILDEIKKGKKYPSGVEIGKHFGISHIWNIVKVSELYNELGLKPYLERKTRDKLTSVLIS